MILVILGICILLIVAGFLIWEILDIEFGGVMAFIGGLSFIPAILVTIVLGVNVSNLKVIDEKITMYQEENIRIEEQVASVVQNYQKHETDIFTEVSPESSMTLVALYPDLKSDALVQEQIKIYTSNNEKIKDLKEKKINGKVCRWWLYFGDGE